MQNHTAYLFANPTPLNIDLGSDRFSMFNKERDIPHAQWVRRQRDRKGSTIFPCFVGTDVS